MSRSPTRGASRKRVADRLQRSVGALSTAATGRMDKSLPWFADLSAEDRSWVSVIVQAGIRGFVDWYRQGGVIPRLSEERDAPSSVLAASVFGAAPRALTGVINLQQTVDLVRLTIEVVEDGLGDILAGDELVELQADILRFGRELAFATAQVHARAAEARGAWDARLESLVVDSVMRAETDESMVGRASALGWEGSNQVMVVLGQAPPSRLSTATFDDVRRAARAAGLDALCAAQGERMVTVLGGVSEPIKAATVVAEQISEGPVVCGPIVDSLAGAHQSARAAASAYRVAGSWPQCPRPVRSIELLPERALAGDGHARRQLVDTVYRPLAEAKGLLETVSAFLDHGGSVEASSRSLFVHANTVRYRLRAATSLTDLSPYDAREAFTYRIALVLGRLQSL